MPAINILLDIPETNLNQNLKNQISEFNQFAAGLNLAHALPSSMETLLKIDEINVILTDDRQIQEMNASYRQKDYATDVLTFNYEPSFAGDSAVSEIYISIETALAQSVQHRQTFSQELSLLYVHGLIHAAGIDHERSNEEYVLTKTLEKTLLENGNLKNTKTLLEYDNHGDN